MRADYADPRIRDAVYDLLDTSFSRLAERIRLADRMGAPWAQVSTPFVAFDGERPIAHAGVMAIPVVLGGNELVVGGIHAVCTRPTHRGRGHFRTVMTEALEFCDRHFPSTWLFTGTPELYGRFGFRVVADRFFESEQERAPDRPDRPPPFRALSADSPADVDLLHSLLRKRAPVSERVAVVDPGWLFVMNEAFASRGFARLFYSEDLHAVAAYERRCATLHLLDLVAERVPSITEVLRRIPGGADTVVLHFPPDCSGGGPWRTEANTSGDRWMVRGPLDADNGPVALSPLGRC